MRFYIKLQLAFSQKGGDALVQNIALLPKSVLHSISAGKNLTPHTFFQKTVILHLNLLNWHAHLCHC